MDLLRRNRPSSWWWMLYLATAVMALSDFAFRPSHDWDKLIIGLLFIGLVLREFYVTATDRLLTLQQDRIDYLEKRLGIS